MAMPQSRSPKLRRSLLWGLGAFVALLWYAVDVLPLPFVNSWCLTPSTHFDALHRKARIANMLILRNSLLGLRSDQVISVLSQYSRTAETSPPDCPTDNVIHIFAGNACSFNDVVMGCELLGSRLRGLHVAVTCDLHLDVDHSATYDVVSRALQSLRDAGYLLKFGFINSEAT